MGFRSLACLCLQARAAAAEVFKGAAGQWISSWPVRGVSQNTCACLLQGERHPIACPFGVGGQSCLTSGFFSIPASEVAWMNTGTRKPRAVSAAEKWQNAVRSKTS